MIVNNADRNAAVGALSYEFQIATDQGFSKIRRRGHL